MSDARSWVFVHGWGMSAQDWAVWRPLLAPADRFLAVDRGYYGCPQTVTVSALRHDRVVLVLHSFALHWVDPDLINRADVILAFSTFLSFHQGRADERQSRRILNRMIAKFEHQPHAVLRDFLDRVWHPLAPRSTGTQAIRAELLYPDLMALNQSRFDPAAVCNKKLYVFHGTEDRIVPASVGEQWRHVRSESTFTPIAGAGHALPFEDRQRIRQWVRMVEDALS